MSFFRSSLFSLALALLIILAACDAVEETPSPESGLLIGVALPQTGTLGTAGQSVTNGVHLALRDQINPSDEDLALVIYDTRSTASGAVDAYQKLINFENLIAVIGPVSSTATEAIIPSLQGGDVISLGPTSSKSGLSSQSEYLFRSSLTVSRIAPDGIRTSKANLGYTNVATLHNTADAFSVSSNEMITEELRSYNDINIVAEASYSRPTGTSLSESDIDGPLSQVLSASPSVDAIFLSGLPEDHITILPAAYRRNNEAPFIINLLSIAEVHTINDLEPGAAEGAVSLNIWAASSPLPESQNFVRNYTTHFGMSPDDWAARGYVGTSLLIEALRRDNSRTPSSLKESLASIKDFPTIFGPFSFDDNGDGGLSTCDRSC